MENGPRDQSCILKPASARPGSTCPGQGWWQKSMPRIFLAICAVAGRDTVLSMMLCMGITCPVQTDYMARGDDETVCAARSEHNSAGGSSRVTPNSTGVANGALSGDTKVGVQGARTTPCTLRSLTRRLESKRVPAADSNSCTMVMGSEAFPFFKRIDGHSGSGRSGLQGTTRNLETRRAALVE